ncbi:MAG: hypothetical protein WC524_00875 [Candidatus Aminicenantales bacterium]
MAPFLLFLSFATSRFFFRLLIKKTALMSNFDQFREEAAVRLSFYLTDLQNQLVIEQSF